MVMLITLFFTVVLCGAVSAANGTWVNETVDNSSTYTGQHTSIALDSSNNPHISYIDSNSQNLMYAYKDSSGWHRETIDGSHETWDGASGPTSIALDSSGRPHISYTGYNGGHPNVKYAYYDGSAWQVEIAIPGGAGGCQESSLALDSAGNPHISCRYFSYDGTTYDLTLQYAYKDGSGWHRENAALLYSGPVQPYTLISDSLTLDSSGNPHISYYYPFTHSLGYAYKDGSGWHYQTVDNLAGDTSISFHDTSIALDSSNNPHISYADNSGHVKYASGLGGVWTVETVESPGVSVGYTSLVLDSLNNPHMSYYSAGNSLKYAVKSGGIWTIETINHEGSADVGEFSHITLDSSGNPYISYSVREYIGGTNYAYLKYAYFMPNSVNPDDPNDPEDPDNSNGSTNQPGNEGSTTHVNAASSTVKTVEMQETGLPIAPLALAILMVLGGIAGTRRK